MLEKMTADSVAQKDYKTAVTNINDLEITADKLHDLKDLVTQLQVAASALVRVYNDEMEEVMAKINMWIHECVKQNLILWANMLKEKDSGAEAFIIEDKDAYSSVVKTIEVLPMYYTMLNLQIFQKLHRREVL